jgi:hypothetical protein
MRIKQRIIITFTQNFSVSVIIIPGSGLSFLQLLTGFLPMKWIFFAPLLLAFIISGCGLQKREALLQEREAQLAQKEQALVVKEKNLQLKAEELAIKEQQFQKGQALDTTSQQAGGIFYPALIGKWNASMTCTETTCAGSAIGDTKTETWELSYQNDRVVARAMAGENLVRIYTGVYKNNLLELTENVELSSAAPATKIVVRLTFVNQNALEGRREIIRAGDCRIIYALQLDRQ